MPLCSIHLFEQTKLKVTKKGVRLGNVINNVPGPTKENNGYDHNFVIARFVVHWIKGLYREGEL